MWQSGKEAMEYILFESDWYEKSINEWKGTCDYKHALRYQNEKQIAGNGEGTLTLWRLVNAVTIYVQSFLHELLTRYYL